MRRLALLLLICACAPEPGMRLEHADAIRDTLTSAQRLHHLEAIRDQARSRGITNGVILGGLSSAESMLIQCYEGVFCPGPYSSYCGGSAMAGGGDGPCSHRQGGIGLFQLDGGNYDETIARDGARVLSLEGNIEAGLDFLLTRLQSHPYGPQLASDDAAIAWLNRIVIDGPGYHDWLMFLTRVYNGCNSFPACNPRYATYDEHAHAILSETGPDFWDVAVTTPPLASTWHYPLDPGSVWHVHGFNVRNAGLGGWSSCYGTSMNQLTHAGEDWMTSANQPVHAVGDGEVVFVGGGRVAYPGEVIVIRHELSGAERTAVGYGVVFSMYSHLRFDVPVSEGQVVSGGDVIGHILWQDINPGDGRNSHLHWELRDRLTVNACGPSEWGPGYTGPGTDARAEGYLAPAGSLDVLMALSTSASCDNDVPPGGTACNPGTPEVEYVCTDPGSTSPWTSRSCAEGWRCVGTSCAPPCDNDIPYGETACRAQGEGVEFVCTDPRAPSAEQWEARACPIGQACIGAGCVPLDGGCASDGDCPDPGELCTDGRCQANQGACAYGDVTSCDAAGCAWYWCSQTCWPRGTHNDVACADHGDDTPGACGAWTGVDACNAAGCAWYGCSSSCWRSGTPLSAACP